MFRVRTYQIVTHIAGWLLFMAFPLLFINGGDQNGNQFRLLASPYYWLFCITYILLFYGNALFLFPRFFLKKKYVLFGVITLALLAGVYFLKPYDRLLRHTYSTRFAAQRLSPMPYGPTDHFMPRPGDGPTPYPKGKDGNRPFGPPPRDSRPPNPGSSPSSSHPFRPVDSISFFIFIMIMALSTATKTIEQWQVTEQRATQAEADKASAELSFLKAQINPHFLFNTLNNIYTLAVIKDDNAPDSIMKLSNIMRYVTDDATADFVPLQNEIDCINDYIELQRLRLGEKTHVDLEMLGETDDKKIAPLILMTFIENVFKYGISKNKASVITIKIAVNENSISFFCQNSLFPKKEEKQRTGIGLTNTRQRLAYLYPEKYLLSINTENDLYTVKLILET